MEGRPIGRRRYQTPGSGRIRNGRIQLRQAEYSVSHQDTRRRLSGGGDIEVERVRFPGKVSGSQMDGHARQKALLWGSLASCGRLAIGPLARSSETAAVGNHRAGCHPAPRRRKLFNFYVAHPPKRGGMGSGSQNGDGEERLRGKRSLPEPAHLQPGLRRTGGSRKTASRGHYRIFIILPVRGCTESLFALRGGRQCLRIMKAIRLPGTLRELLMIIRRFSVWRAKTGSQPPPEWGRRGIRNRLLEGATGGNGIDHPGIDISRGKLPGVEVQSANWHFPPLVAPGACFGG